MIKKIKMIVDYVDCFSMENKFNFPLRNYAFTVGELSWERKPTSTQWKIKYQRESHIFSGTEFINWLSDNAEREVSYKSLLLHLQEKVVSQAMIGEQMYSMAKDIMGSAVIDEVVEENREFLKNLMRVVKKQVKKPRLYLQ